jgi:hypothetical protein
MGDPVPFLFVDFEASSLSGRSHPIEIGFVAESGHGEGHLIIPEPGWDDWSAESQEVHGISREYLRANGRPAVWVARQIRAALARPGTVAVSDAPGFDMDWLGKLLAVIGEAPAVIQDVTVAYGHACRPLLAMLPPQGDARHSSAVRIVGQTAMRIMAEAANTEERRSPLKHRALDDATGLWRTWCNTRRMAEAEAALGLAAALPLRRTP